MPISSSIAVRITNANGEVTTFESVGQATLYYMELRGEDPSIVKPINRRNNVMSLCRKRDEKFGYKWEFVNTSYYGGSSSTSLDQGAASGSTVEQEEGADSGGRDVNFTTHGDENQYTFGDEVDDIFRGNRVRLVKRDGVMHVSIIDVMKIVYPDHDSSAWSRILRQVAERYPELNKYISHHQFPGVGQRSTPICCSMGFLKIVNLLDGPRAAAFRHKSMEVLHRYMSGDLSLVDEIVDRAVVNENPLFPSPVESNQNMINCRVLKAPRHTGDFLGDYSRKHVVYVMSIKFDGKSFVKIGYSDNIMRRMKEHANSYDIDFVWSIVEFQECVALEAELKDRLIPYNVHITIKGKKRTEIYADITPELVDEILLKTRDDKLRECNQTDLEEIKSKQEARTRLIQGRLHVDVQRLEAEVESARLQARIEELDLEMAEMRVQSAERMKRKAEKEMNTAEIQRVTEEIREKTTEIGG